MVVIVVKNNIIIIAAITILLDHVKRDLSCLDEGTTLLSTPRNYLLTLNVESNVQGAYFYYDLNNEQWIRSGKVARRGFDVRYKQPYQKSKSDSHQSKIYSRYPSIGSKQL